MDFAGSLVRHLGLQMYSGAVPAIAELVANAYDADATSVQIEVPLDTALDANSEIVIRDDGLGMTFEDVNEKYLLVGRDRRASGADRSPGGRLVLGRKGLGKLAGFGIAKIVTITGSSYLRWVGADTPSGAGLLRWGSGPSGSGVTKLLIHRGPRLCLSLRRVLRAAPMTTPTATTATVSSACPACTSSMWTDDLPGWWSRSSPHQR